MNLESQVVSLALAKRLKELGVRQESVFTWVDAYPPKDPIPEFFLTFQAEDEELGGQACSAFTVAELGEILPMGIECIKTDAALQWQIIFDSFEEFGKTEADARAKMLIYLIEKGVVKP